jgi:asparagine synthase (glutamine-hydrolysing)
MLKTNLTKFKQEKALLITNEFLETWNYKNYIAAFLPTFTAQQLQQKVINQQNVNQFINKDFLHQNQNTNSLQKPIVKSLQDILNYNTHTFGLQDLLRYADRNSMAHSREVRLPFLNKDLVSFVASLPSNYKINNGFTKWILRESVKDKLPQEIVWRKGKIGYEPPQQQWMQNKQVAEMIMNARQKLVANNVLNSSVLATNIQAKSAHEANNFDWWILCAAQII